MSSLLLVVTTLPSREAADRIAAALVEERLAACVQVTGPVASTYRWKGAVERAEEWRCEAKTSADRWPAIRDRIAALHPYELPEIVALPAEALPSYARWVADEVRTPTSGRIDG